MIDNKIYVLSSFINRLLLEQKLNGEKRSFIPYLEKIRDVINKKFSKNIKDIEFKELNKIDDVDIDITKKINKPVKKLEKIDMLNIGDKVRLYLQKNTKSLYDDDVIMKNADRRRVGDILWSPEIYEITDMIVRPSTSNFMKIYYEVNNDKTTRYMRNELMLVDKYSYDVPRDVKELEHKEKNIKMKEKLKSIVFENLLSTKKQKTKTRDLLIKIDFLIDKYNEFVDTFNKNKKLFVKADEKINYFNSLKYMLKHTITNKKYDIIRDHIKMKNYPKEKINYNNVLDIEFIKISNKKRS